jgi:putative flippase GtrA
MVPSVIARVSALWHAVLSGEATWLRYVLASVIALGCDTGLFLLTLASMGALAASALGYTFGIAVHWLVSSRAVFAGQTAERGPERHRQKALFVGSALVGLAVTMAIVGGAEAVSFDPRIAKLVAIIVSFQATYLLRRNIVFA